MMTPVAIVTDAPRTVIGPDHPAAAVGIIIGVVVIGVIRPVEEAPVKVMVVREPIAAAVEDRNGTKPAAMEYGAAAAEGATMKYRAATAVKAAATTVETTSAAATAVSTTADFSCQPAGGGFRRRRRARVDQRQRFCALRDNRQRQHRGGRGRQRNEEAADNAARGI